MLNYIAARVKPGIIINTIEAGTSLFYTYDLQILLESDQKAITHNICET